MTSRGRRRRTEGRTRTQPFALSGGLNLVDPPILLRAGELLVAINYELRTRGGYRRIDGIERFDGQAKPSDASYWILNFTGGSAAISEGDIVDGATSGASGEALIDAVVTSGSYGGSDAAGYLVLTAIAGTFQDAENLEVSAATKSVASGAAVERNAGNDSDDATWAQDAIETQRAKIGKVGATDGSGNIRGAHVYKGDVYAFRDNTAGTECLMWKATSSGWVQQSLGNRVNFTAGTAAFAEGETLTGGSSTATATIKRVVVTSGDWSTNDAAGYLIIGAVTTAPYQAETGTSASGSATLSGAESANTLQPGGRFEFVNHNFYANTDRFRMYGVDGVSQGFEWDGSVFVPIDSGNTVDTPQHVAAFKQHLFFSFPGGSLQHSDTGLPYEWAAGGEIGVGDDITNINEEVGGVLAVLARNKTQALYGTSKADWDLRTISEESGAIEWTAQRIGATRYLDDRGLTQMSSVDKYGDFLSSVISQKVAPALDSRISLAESSVIVKKKNQYRLFYSDGTGLVMTLDGSKVAGFTTLNYENPDNGNPLPVLVTANGEDSDGSEVVFFGSDTGYLYQMDQGTSMDGAAVEAVAMLAYSDQKSSAQNKQYKKAVLDLDAVPGTTILLKPVFDYDTSRTPGDVDFNKVLTEGGASRWGVAVWDQFIWGDGDVARVEGNITGVGRNIGLLIRSNDTYIEPHTLFSMTYHYHLRRLVR